MDHSPITPLIPLYIAQTLFGVTYALLIHWLAVNSYLKGQTAYSVVVGDAMILFIQWLFFPHSWEPLVTFGSFVFSGLPMIVSYLVRHQQRVQSQSHKRRPLPNNAMRVRDEAVMDISSMINRIVEKKAEVVDVVHELHQLNGKLKSM